MKKKLYILDVSGFIFRAYYALPPMTNAKGEATHALYGFIRQILKLRRDYTAEHLVAIFDGPDNKKERKAIYSQYKENREQVLDDLPEQLERAKEFLSLLGITSIELPGVEADDTMGSVAKWAEKEGVESYLCTADKDLCQLVSDHTFVLNPWKDLVIDAAKVEELYGVPPSQIIDLLAIMGDASDNIPGLKGFGPKTAISLLKEFGSLDYLLEHPEEVKGAKKQETLKEESETARLSYQLATIQTSLDFPKSSTLYAIEKEDREALKTFYLEMGFTTLAREVEGEEREEESVNYTLIDDPQALEMLIKKLQKAKAISFDLETTHLDPLLAQPVGIGFCIRPLEAAYVPFNGALGKERALRALKPLFEDENNAFFAHNAKFDMHVLKNVDIEVKTLCFDTILASYVLHAESRRHSLDHLSLHLFGKVKTPIKDLIGSGKKTLTMDLVPIEKVANYCCEDVDYTFRLKELFEKELKERSLLALYNEIELPLLRVLLEMERRGIFLNAPHLEALSHTLKEEIETLKAQIFSLSKTPFNLNSPKQLSHVLFETLEIKPLKKTSTGYSTNADVLEALKDEHSIIPLILEYRSLEKLRSTYVDTLPSEMNPKTRRVHPTFTQFVTATGRLSCQNPNLQNIPVRSSLGKEIRKAFMPEKEGWSFLSADYSQIELRLLAHLSKDPNLIRAFQNGEDVHRTTASLVFDIPLEQVSSEQRYQAKAINFGILYGQGSYGLSRELGVSMKEASALIEAYFERYPAISGYIEKTLAETQERGKAVTMVGRERALPDLTSKNAQVRSAAERLAINTPLQGSAADLIKLAMLRLHDLLIQKKMKSFLILQIHDELIFEAPDSELDVLKPLVKETMEGVFDLEIPLVVDVSIGKNWAEC